MFKLNKLIRCVYLNSFYLFIFIIFGLTNFKIYKHLKNFDFIFFIERPNMGKYFSLNIYIFYFFNRMICDARTFRKIKKKLKKIFKKCSLKNNSIYNVVFSTPSSHIILKLENFQNYEGVSSKHVFNIN